MKHGKVSRIGYWAYTYSPKWEASSQELKTLSTALAAQYDIGVISQSMHDWEISFRGKNKTFPFPLSLLAFPFYRKIAASYQINHIFSSLVEPVLIPRIGDLNTIATITKDSDSLTRFEKNIPHFKKLRYVVVESERHRNILKQAGIDSGSIKLIYPGAPVKPYKRASSPFKILFATSPLGKYGLLSRGVYLLMQTAKALPEVRFILAWRERNHNKLKSLINHYRLKNVEVMNSYIPDMDKVYQSVHATVLPGLTHSSLKPCPHSGLNSLSHGKPLLVSESTSIAGIVDRNQCGVTFEHSVDSLRTAIHHLMDRYTEFQNNSHRTVEREFSESVFVERYRQLYETML